MSTPEQQVQEFNERFAVGQAVFLQLDDGSLEETRLRSRAWAMPSGSVIAKIDGHAGGWLISRIHPRDDSTQVNLT